MDAVGRMIRRNRKSRFKRVINIRKARDMASKYRKETMTTKEAEKVAGYFEDQGNGAYIWILKRLTGQGDINIYNRGRLAKMLYRHMEAEDSKPPLVKAVNEAWKNIKKDMPI